MTFVRKLILVGLLMLVLPLQGIASVALACAHEPHPPAPAAAVPAMAMAHDHAVTVMPGFVRHGAAHTHQTPCVACHACCVGAALPPVAEQGAPLVRAPSTAFPNDAGGTVLFLTGGIERPPRNAIA